MIHLLLAVVYIVIGLYYCYIPSQLFGLQVHAIGSTLLVLYCTLRHFALPVFDDRIVFLPMQISVYLIVFSLSNSQPQPPVWTLAYLFWCIVENLVQRAESRLYILVSEVGRVVPQWGFEFLYTHESDPRLHITTHEEREHNDAIYDFTQLRQKNEVPVGLDQDEKLLWKLSQHRRLFLPPNERYFLFTVLKLGTAVCYMAWWISLLTSFRYYFLIDLSMTVALMSDNKHAQLFTYHGAFMLATIYLQFPSITGMHT